VAALKKARQQYLQRSEDLEKTKAVTAKAGDELTAGNKTLDKRRKSRDDAHSKVWCSGSDRHVGFTETYPSLFFGSTF
jgi:hypothetical protein